MPKICVLMFPSGVEWPDLELRKRIAIEAVIMREWLQGRQGFGGLSQRVSDSLLSARTNVNADAIDDSIPLDEVIKKFAKEFSRSAGDFSSQYVPDKRKPETLEELERWLKVAKALLNEAENVSCCKCAGNRLEVCDERPKVNEKNFNKSPTPQCWIHIDPVLRAVISETESIYASFAGDFGPERQIQAEFSIKLGKKSEFDANVEQLPASESQVRRLRIVINLPDFSKRDEVYFDLFYAALHEVAVHGPQGLALASMPRFGPACRFTEGFVDAAVVAALSDRLHGRTTQLSQDRPGLISRFARGVSRGHTARTDTSQIARANTSVRQSLFFELRGEGADLFRVLEISLSRAQAISLALRLNLVLTDSELREFVFAALAHAVGPHATPALYGRTISALKTFLESGDWQALTANLGA